MNRYVWKRMLVNRREMESFPYFFFCLGYEGDGETNIA